VAIMLCYVDLENMITTTSTTMTSMEEWIFFLEYTYGRSRNRWEDHVRDWNLPVKALRKLLNNKLEQELQTRQNWLMYAFVGEDIELREKGFWRGIGDQD
jgi:hypothetical protein